jgi:hypothetical protein
LAPERHNNRLLGRSNHGGPGFGGSHRGIHAEFPAQLYHFSAPPPNLWRADRRLALTVLQFGQRFWSWHSDDELVPECLLTFRGKDRTIKPWNQTLRFFRMGHHCRTPTQISGRKGAAPNCAMYTIKQFCNLKVFQNSRSSTK